MFENVKVDFGGYCLIARVNAPTKKIVLFLTAYGFHATMVYRFGKWAERQPALIKLILMLLYYPLEFCIGNLYGIHINRKATIGKGFYIAHFGGISIGRCTIGSFCKIHQHVKIISDTNGYPSIGNQVWIGPHAQVIGSLSIGHGAAVGIGSILKTDIGERCLALGNPARVVNKNFDNSDILVLGPRKQGKTKTVVQVKPVLPGLSQQPAQV